MGLADPRVRVGIWRTIPQQWQQRFSGKNTTFEKVGYIFIALEARKLLFSACFWKFGVPAWSFRGLWDGLWRVFEPYFQLFFAFVVL